MPYPSIETAPGPRGTAVVQSLMAFRRQPFQTLKTFAQYGDVVRLPTPRRPLYLINHPAYAKHVLVSNASNYLKSTLNPRRLYFRRGVGVVEGQTHRRKRTVAQPAFNHRSLDSYVETITQLTDQHLAAWEPGQTIDLLSEFKLLFRAILNQCLFSYEMTPEAHRAMAALENIKQDFAPLDITAVGKMWNRLPTPRQRRLAHNRRTLDAFIFTLIEERLAAPNGPDDLLAMLLDAATADEPDQNAVKERVRDEFFNLYGGGYDTMALALVWAFDHLDQYPHIESQLHVEVDRVVGDRWPTLEDLPALEYTSMVLAESMRVRPITWTLLPRVAQADDTVGGYAVPAGTNLVIIPYLMHRHPEFWPDAEAFRPERFQKEAVKERPYYAYLPFGGGAHKCIGEHFAWMADRLVLTMVAQRFRFRVAAERPIATGTRVPLQPKDGLPVVVERRADPARHRRIPQQAPHEYQQKHVILK